MMRVGMAVPRRTRCGIADYAACVAEALAPEVTAAWIDLDGLTSCREYRRAGAAARDIDVALVHYEYELFRHVSPLRNGFAAFMDGLTVPAVVVLHNALPRLDGPLPVSPARRRLLRLLYAPFSPWWEARQYRRAAEVVVHAPDIEARARRFLDGTRVFYTPHPVRRVACRWTGPADSPVRLVTPGFIKPHKGYEEGLAVLAAHPGWRWVLAGGPQDARDEVYVARLRRAAQSLGVLPRLEFTGYLPATQLESLCAGASGAFFPFRSVTGSGSMTWAIGMGLPLFATDLPATRRLAGEGAGIALLPASDSAGWVALMGRVLGDRAALAELSRRNLEFAGRYGYDRFAADLKTRLLAAAGRAP